MKTEDIIIKKITPKKGFLLTDGDTVTNAIFVGATQATSAWWEIPDPDYAQEFDGSDYLYPLTYINGMEVEADLWYTNGEDTWEAIKSGMPINFNDSEYFDILS